MSRRAAIRQPVLRKRRMNFNWFSDKHHIVFWWFSDRWFCCSLLIFVTDNKVIYDNIQVIFLWMTLTLQTTITKKLQRLLSIKSLQKWWFCCSQLIVLWYNKILTIKRSFDVQSRTVNVSVGAAIGKALVTLRCKIDWFYTLIWPERHSHF